MLIAAGICDSEFWVLRVINTKPRGCVFFSSSLIHHHFELQNFQMLIYHRMTFSYCKSCFKRCFTMQLRGAPSCFTYRCQSVLDSKLWNEKRLYRLWFAIHPPAFRHFTTNEHRQSSVGPRELKCCMLCVMAREPCQMHIIMDFMSLRPLNFGT